MQNIKAKLEEYIEKEMRSTFEVEEGIEQRYQDECRKAVLAIVNKVYEVLIYRRCVPHYESKPYEFLSKELPEYALGPCKDLITGLFENYTPELFKIFETHLLDTIRDINLQTNNRFIKQMLDYIHTETIRHYKVIKNEVEKSLVFRVVKNYESVIDSFVSLINKEKESERDDEFCYNTYLRNLESEVDYFIKDLKRYSKKGNNTMDKNHTRYIYFYIQERILSKF